MKNGAQTGPVSTEELQVLLSSGSIPNNTLVWRNGLAGWVAANTLPEFAASIPVSAPQPPPAAGVNFGTNAGGPPTEITPDPADVEKNKAFGIISYISILFLVPLLAARESKFAMYHCNQGLVLTLTWFAVWIAERILATVLWHIPGGWALLSLISLATWVGMLALAIIGIINAANGRCKPLPVIGNRFTLVK